MIFWSSMRFYRAFITGLLALAPGAANAAYALATKPDRAVMATVDSYFSALNRHDEAGIADVTVPDGNLTSLANGKDGAVKVRHTTWATFLEYFAKDKDRRKETVGRHKVAVNGDVAMVWNSYAYFTNNRFSHCGTNHIDLVRHDGRWKILNLTWTEAKTGCKVR